jgi:putative ABC transport system substrate-binding protein
VRLIGVLMPGDENDPEYKTRVSALIQVVAGLGWTDGRNVRMVLRWGGADINRIRALAQELVGLQPDIILTNGIVATAALQRETRTIPIVFGSAGDPVATLSEIAPGLKRAAIMFNPDIAPISAYMPSFETAARLLKVEPIIAPIHSDEEIEEAVKSLGREPGGGLVVLPEAFTQGHHAAIILAAARNNVPAVYWQSAFARDGGLLSYGPDPVDTGVPPPPTWIAFCAGRSRAISRCSSRPSSRSS